MTAVQSEVDFENSRTNFKTKKSLEMLIKKYNTTIMLHYCLDLHLISFLDDQLWFDTE